jgi:hypothetical protein
MQSVLHQLCIVSAFDRLRHCCIRVCRIVKTLIRYTISLSLIAERARVGRGVLTVIVCQISLINYADNEHV